MGEGRTSLPVDVQANPVFISSWNRLSSKQWVRETELGWVPFLSPQMTLPATAASSKPAAGVSDTTRPIQVALSLSNPT